MSDIEAHLKQTEARQAWENVGIGNHHGIALPLFSLHTENSCGIGEYLDLIELIAWCKEVGMDVIQLLPLNDTGLGTSPYSSISAFALNPVYLSLHALPHLDRIVGVETKLKKIAYWTLTERVKHHIVRELKNVFFKEYIPGISPLIEQSTEFQSFIESNADWLEPYALFKSLKEKHYWKRWEEWPAEHRNPDHHHYQELLIQCQEAILFHQILQFLCYQQLAKVKAKAAQAGVFLKGDIPILINRDSAEVWNNREYFLLDYSAGAPPDIYSIEGQDWGFPLYDWKALELDEDEWWKSRLRFASSFYHIYRIDHIVGFFRIWAIPKGEAATAGHFLPTQSSEWVPLGTRTMKMMLANSSMLPIGEDLGALTQEIRSTLTQLGICGTKVMRWERYYQEDGRYIPPTDYPPISMTTVSTHDSDPLILWWKHAPKEARQFCEFKGWDYRPFLTPDRQKEILLDSHSSGSLFHINLLHEYLGLFSELISPYGANERINIPGKVLDTNWTYRFKPSVSQLIQNQELTQTVREIVKGRNP